METTSTEGPLSAQAGRGASVSMEPPSDGARSMTFGAFILCTTEPGAEIVIDAIRYDVAPEPLELQAWFRYVPDESERQDPSSSDWAPVVGAAGLPPRFTPDSKPLGSFTQGLPTSPITQECTKPLPGNPHTELMTALTVDRKGALIHQTYVNYHVGDDSYTLKIDWRNGICGTDLPKQYRCKP